MKVLIIGGAGYIGSHVARMLLDNGHAVTVFDNLSSGCRENLFPDAQFVEGDILEQSHLEAATSKEQYDAMVHLAAFKAASYRSKAMPPPDGLEVRTESTPLETVGSPFIIVFRRSFSKAGSSRPYAGVG